VVTSIESMIGHMKSHGHLGFLKGREGSAINVILTAVSHNLLRLLLRPILGVLLPALPPNHTLKSRC
jgi:transposase, IS5 family